MSPFFLAVKSLDLFMVLGLIKQLTNLNMSIFHGSNEAPQNHRICVSGEVLDVPVSTL